jgi:hypothetical protein
VRNTLAGLAAVLALSGAAFAQVAGDNPFQRDKGKLPPPAAAVAVVAPVAAPPEGPGAGGLDFGAWRGADTAAYGPSFERRVRALAAGKPVSQTRAALQANGFSCLEPNDRGGAGPALECRIAVTDRSCGVEWWTVIEEPLAAPKAGFDRMCR